MESDREEVRSAVCINAQLGFTFLLLSDVVVQIVDARNPLLFRCEDLVS